MFNKYLNYAWHVIGDNYLPIAPYTGIGTIDTDRSTDIPTEPIEEGKLTAYNNVQQPQSVNVTLYFDGDYTVQVLALAMLDDVIADGKLSTIFSPTWIWRNMALTHYDYSRASNAGATLLSVNCSFQEVRSIVVESQTYTETTVKKSTSVSKKSTGQTTTKEITKKRTGIAHISDSLTGSTK